MKILGEYPEIGTARPDVAAEVRMLVDSSYLILHRIRVAGVQIVRVLHGARNIGWQLFEGGE